MSDESVSASETATGPATGPATGAAATGAAATGAAPEEIEQRCIAIIAKAKLIPESSVTTANTFDELAIDSLDKINISFEIEDTFHIQIPDNAIGSLKTVGDMVAGVIRLQQEPPLQAAAPNL